MRHAAILLTAFMLAIAPAAAVVGHNGSGDMSITSGSSASASTAVGPNGTDYRAEVKMTGESPEANESITNVSFSTVEGQEKASFNGTVVAPNPCHVLDHEVEEEGDRFIMDIQTVEESQSNGSVCATVLAPINYEASFQSEAPYTLEIQHNGEEVKTVEAEGESPTEEPKKGGLLGWLVNLLGL